MPRTSGPLHSLGGFRSRRDVAVVGAEASRGEMCQSMAPRGRQYGTGAGRVTSSVSFSPYSRLHGSGFTCGQWCASGPASCSIAAAYSGCHSFYGLCGQLQRKLDPTLFPKRWHRSPSATAERQHQPHPSSKQKWPARDHPQLKNCFLHSSYLWVWVLR